MSASYLIFDFAGNEEAAQQARHRVEHWRQAFRLGNKLAFKFERSEAEEGKKADPHIRMLIRVDFSDHEKLSRQRWMERIPADEHFKSVTPKTVSPSDADYSSTADKFESLD